MVYTTLAVPKTAPIKRILCILVNVLYVILALWPPVLQYQLPALLFVCFIRFVFFLFVLVVSGKPKQKQGPQTSSSPPVIFIAGRPKAAVLFWFFGDFRCGALLFMVIHVI